MPTQVNLDSSRGNIVWEERTSLKMPPVFPFQALNRIRFFFPPPELFLLNLTKKNDYQEEKVLFFFCNLHNVISPLDFHVRIDVSAPSPPD